MMSTASRSVTVVPTSTTTAASATKLLELCEQYFIAGWLSSLQHEHYREQLQIIMIRPTSINHLSRNSSSSSNDEIELLAQQIQESISTAQQKEKQHQHQRQQNELQFDENDITRSKKNKIAISTTTTSSNTSLIYTPLEFQKQVLSQNIDVKELFVEMTFYSRLGYIQPPCCLHCTYTECYNNNARSKEIVAVVGDDDDDQQQHTNKTKIKSNQIVNYQHNHNKCHRYVIWRKDTNIILHPDTIATNIVLLPCYLVRQLLQDGEKQPSSQNNKSMMMIASTKYQYDPIQKSITLK